MTPNHDDDSNGWGSYKRLVLAELERLEGRIARDFAVHSQNDERIAEELRETLRLIYQEQSSVREAIAALKVKSGIWGAVGGALPAIVTLIVVYLEMKGA